MSLFFGSSKRDSNSFPPHSNLNHGENSLILDHPNRYQEPLNDPLYMNNNNIQFPIPPMDQALVPVSYLLFKFYPCIRIVGIIIAEKKAIS